MPKFSGPSLWSSRVTSVFHSLQQLDLSLSSPQTFAPHSTVSQASYQTQGMELLHLVEQPSIMNMELLYLVDHPSIMMNMELPYLVEHPSVMMDMERLYLE